MIRGPEGQTVDKPSHALPACRERETGRLAPLDSDCLSHSHSSETNICKTRRGKRAARVKLFTSDPFPPTSAWPALSGFGFPCRDEGSGSRACLLLFLRSRFEYRTCCFAAFLFRVKLSQFSQRQRCPVRIDLVGLRLHALKSSHIGLYMRERSIFIAFHVCVGEQLYCSFFFSPAVFPAGWRFDVQLWKCWMILDFHLTNVTKHGN